MSKPPERWPIWKIAVGTAGCAVGAAVLFGLSVLLEHLSGGPPVRPDGRAVALSFPTFLMMIGTGVSVLCALGLGWLAYRLNEARKPAWERQRKKKRR